MKSPIKKRKRKLQFGIRISKEGKKKKKFIFLQNGTNRDKMGQISPRTNQLRAFDSRSLIISLDFIYYSNLLKINEIWIILWFSMIFKCFIKCFDAEWSEYYVAHEVRCFFNMQFFCMFCITFIEIVLLEWRCLNEYSWKKQGHFIRRLTVLKGNSSRSLQIFSLDRHFSH